MKTPPTDPRLAFRPALPEPSRKRWQPLRLGLVDIFLYDSEEFWFRDGHLLLRGNNGTGKSKVLSLTLPFLFDAILRPSRIEPDGDNGKKMAWNLLMNEHPRRIGYTWIEFGMLDAEGKPRYLTLGAGLSAVAGKTQVDHWFFIIEGQQAGQDARIGDDFWLVNEHKVALTRERLREALEENGRGVVFEHAQPYRRAVDERLFQLGPRRYDALMDTLIQLRQPQLSKKPDEAGLSHALTEALPPLPSELLTDVAQAFNQLEEDREQLEKIRALEKAIGLFEQRYRTYAGVLTRRQARDLRQAQTLFDSASELRNKASAEMQRADEAESVAREAHEASRVERQVARERLETLQSDPANQDANRLTQAENDAAQRRVEAATAKKQRDTAHERLRNDEITSLKVKQQAEEAQAEIRTTRSECVAEAEPAGVLSRLSNNAFSTLVPDALATLPAAQSEAARQDLRQIVRDRRESIRHLEGKLTAVDAKQNALNALRDIRQERDEDHQQALARRAEADAAADAEGEALFSAWSAYCDQLVQLDVEAPNELAKLAEWTPRPDGDNPMQGALSRAFVYATQSFAQRESDLRNRRKQLDDARGTLEDEKRRLEAGEDATPPVPTTRDAQARESRVGAPLWRLVDFHANLSLTERAGLEAALEACGLLDAWITPDGDVLSDNGSPILDTQWQRRCLAEGERLSGQLIASLPQQCSVKQEIVEALLDGIAFGSHDPGTSESWISADGRFRLGALSGAWSKASAIYIGHTARQTARERRLREIASELEALDAEIESLISLFDTLAHDRSLAQKELDCAPIDSPLRQAVLAAQSCAREVSQARMRLDVAEAQCRGAEDELATAREELANDAKDLQLPSTRDTLASVANAVERFDDAIQNLVRAVQQWCNTSPRLLEQQARETLSREELEEREGYLMEAMARAEAAQTRYETLQETVGVQVEALRRAISAASDSAKRAEAHVDKQQERVTSTAADAAAKRIAAQNATDAFNERVQARALAIDHLKRFTHSGLLTSALPNFSFPLNDVAWTIEAALNVARRAEQTLHHVPDDDAGYERIQRQLGEDFTELMRSLSALGHQASSEPNEWGLTVHIVYQNKQERPDALLGRLANDIAERSMLLSARERQVLENHLQAEIAAEIQRLMRSADKQVKAINDELHKRPTTTGVRYRLQWLPLSVDEGGPIGLDIARERLLNTSADLWSEQDRHAVGEMLRAQIEAERIRVEQDTAGPGVGLGDQLARALDYRRWHRFSVQRQQDGQWRKLSGPASSGERALGLTVPLFAAISSFYGHGASPHAPRLMLLDEAFAGIDDPARAHCWALIREFDLDFVITSEREWACSAELPGVSICQLLRREGVDAVYVSRWTWDGTTTRLEPDPDRRFPS
ncbi:TIGR02680 family protein [Paraburkholderia bannensis]|uniref:TIGR02680 family protein n=1 Tax=Paraburkholderia bannensis TaxID=765414 RepID=UPI002ABD772F|nr:TIGR02680 family protein [Paraburkholderia bannensis]